MKKVLSFFYDMNSSLKVDLKRFYIWNVTFLILFLIVSNVFSIGTEITSIRPNHETSLLPWGYWIWYALVLIFFVCIKRKGTQLFNLIADILFSYNRFILVFLCLHLVVFPFELLVASFDPSIDLDTIRSNSKYIEGIAYCYFYFLLFLLGKEFFKKKI